MITPGSTLPVVVDPMNPQKLVVDWSGETRARAMGAAAAAGVYPTVSQPGPGMPMPNTLSSSAPAAAPNTLSGTPQIGQSGPAAAGTGVGFATPMGMLGMSAGQGQTMVSFGGTGVDLSSIYTQLAAAGVTITGGMPQMVSGSMSVVDARPGDVAEHLAQLKATGHAGTAAVTGAQDMGLAIHGNALAMLELSVTPQGGTPIRRASRRWSRRPPRGVPSSGARCRSSSIRVTPRTSPLTGTRPSRSPSGHRSEATHAQ